MTHSQIRPSELSRSVTLFEVKPGKKFSLQVLKDLLPDIETALFFGKVYELNASQLGTLLHELFKTPLTTALFGEDHVHSHELQDYLVDIASHVPNFNEGDLVFDAVVPDGEILPHVWESLEVEVADSIKAVAEKMESVIDKLPGKQGQMMFKSMNVMNAKRPILGDYKAYIHHAPQKQNLVILDVSGSMTEATIHAIVEDVVALSYKANAHLAIVSETCTYWEPGTYDADSVLEAAEFWGTHYEQLSPLFDRDWGTVVTVADYDSASGAKSVLARCPGRIDQVLDISLVNCPTYLSECVGQLASEVRPLLIANTAHVLNA